MKDLGLNEEMEDDGEPSDTADGSIKKAYLQYGEVRGRKCDEAKRLVR